MTPFFNINALIIDMDGVLWHGNHPVPGLIDFFYSLRKKEIPFILATNNASLTSQQYINKLNSMGVSVTTNEILTSGMATANYLSTRFESENTRIFVIGESGATQPLLDRGFTLTTENEITDKKSGSDADIVVCGLDRALTWNKLSTATLNIRAGAHFFGTNGDTSLPTEKGATIGNGSILAALEAATGVKPTLIGKPEPVMYQQAMKLLQSKPDNTLVIGDRLDTDILGAVRADMSSIMVLSGISSKEDLKTLPYHPTWVMQDICEITEVLNAHS